MIWVMVTLCRLRPVVAFVFLLCLLALVGNLRAQDNPQQLAELVLERFRTGTPEAFAAVYPFPEGQAMQADAVKNRMPRDGALARVISQSDSEAILLLAAHGRNSLNAGDAVWMTAQLGGLHRAVKEASRWKLVERLPIDHGNRMLAQDLDVTVIPNQGLSVTDKISTDVESQYGWAALLNSNAKITSILVNGSPATYVFAANLLWIDVPRQSKAQLQITYQLDIEEGPNDCNSGCFLKRAGHVRNQYAWHPLFWFGNLNGSARFSITARIPSAYYLATSLPQNDTVEGNTRVVRGRSIGETPALTLSYDRDWQPRRVTAGATTLEIFATPDFVPAPEKIVAEFRRSYEVLEKRFGSPSGGYFAIVQGRSRSGGGWHNIANQAVFAGYQGGRFYSAEPFPQANFFHEVSHAWTSGAAPADHFLTEGWATFAESILLREQFGEEVVRRFWETQAKWYFEQHDGKSALLRDPSNAGVAYNKGAWIFRMLEASLGREKFDAAAAKFSQASLQKPASVEDFLAIFEEARPGVAELLRPYIDGLSAPRITGRIESSRLILDQQGSAVRLALEIEIETAAGKTRRTVDFLTKVVSIDVGPKVQSIRLDPDWKLLLNPVSRSLIEPASRR